MNNAHLASFQNAMNQQNDNATTVRNLTSQNEYEDAIRKATEDDMSQSSLINDINGIVGTTTQLTNAYITAKTHFNKVKKGAVEAKKFALEKKQALQNSQNNTSILSGIKDSLKSMQMQDLLDGVKKHGGDAAHSALKKASKLKEDGDDSLISKANAGLSTVISKGDDIKRQIQDSGEAAKTAALDAKKSVESKANTISSIASSTKGNIVDHVTTKINEQKAKNNSLLDLLPPQKRAEFLQKFPTPPKNLDEANQHAAALSSSISTSIGKAKAGTSTPGQIQALRNVSSSAEESISRLPKSLPKPSVPVARPSLPQMASTRPSVRPYAEHEAL